jgi:hypothetical protein
VTNASSPDPRPAASERDVQRHAVDKGEVADAERRFEIGHRPSGVGVDAFEEVVEAADAYIEHRWVRQRGRRR